MLAAAGAPTASPTSPRRWICRRARRTGCCRNSAALGWAEQDGAEGRTGWRCASGCSASGFCSRAACPDRRSRCWSGWPRETRELVRLTVATGDGLVWLGSAQGAPARACVSAGDGGTLVLHATANGKAFLATLPTRGAAAGAARRLRLAFARRRRPCARTRRCSPTSRAFGCAAMASRSRRPSLASPRSPWRSRARTALALGTVSVAGPSLRLPPARIPELAAALRETASVLGVASGRPEPSRERRSD